MFATLCKLFLGFWRKGRSDKCAAILFLADVLWAFTLRFAAGQIQQSLSTPQAARSESHEGGLETKDLVTLTFSLLALGISVFTLWRTHLSPHKLLISAPVITNFPDRSPSLAVDFAFANLGARTALISDIRIRPYRNNESAPFELRVQRILDRFTANPNLPEKGDKAALFLSFVVKGGDSKSDRFFFSVMEGHQWTEDDVLQVNGLLFDFRINEIWKKAVFVIGFDGYRDKFKGGNIIEVPEKGFWPYYYSHVGWRRARGRFWS
jgi:hypothetical protein